MGDISKNFSYKDFIKSSTAPEALEGITFTKTQETRVFYLTTTIVQPGRDYVRRAVYITNGIRTPALVAALERAGYAQAKDSDHDYEEPDQCCADITCGNPKEAVVAEANETLFQFIRNRLPYAFGQLIAYRDEDGKIKHIHVSMPTKKHQGEVWESRHGDKRLTRLPSTTL